VIIAASDSVPFDRIADLIAAFTKRYRLPGISLAMTYGGKLKLVACHGFSDLEKKVPLNPGNVFRVASVSKPVTSAAICKLVENGQLSLQDRVFDNGGPLWRMAKASRQNDRINRARIEKITVQHLLEHTAGGWSIVNDPMFDARALKLDQRQLIRWTIDHLPLQSEPGEKYAYSNFGYCLLGRVIELITGTGYATAVQQLVLRPAGVKAMAVALDNSRERLPREVMYYQENADPYGPEMNVHRMDAHGGWVASPIDLVRFAVHVDGFDSPADVLGKETIRAMSTPSNPEFPYAKGWQVNSSSNWWHTGGFPGGSSMLARIHDGHCWAVVVNTRPDDQARYFRDLDTLPWNIKRLAEGTWDKLDLFESRFPE
jgi:CubicO group peptidase (beta-lactamase class C family)